MRLRSRLPKLKGYIRLVGRYISHERVFFILTAVLVLGAVYVRALHPSVMRLLMSMKQVPEIVVNSVYMEGYSGKARLVSKDGELIYEGGIENGMVEGYGLLYSDGELVYEGEFKENTYSGRGSLYSEGRLIYTGGFAENLFSGAGTLYTRDGTPEYEGEFVLGQKSGKGRSFEGGVLCYEGGFTDGVFDGQGKLYDGRGRTVYDGQWAFGRYEGQGKLYKSGSLIYEGEFSGGVYNGEGREYYPETGFPKYVGRFINGNYMSSGQQYDEKGRPVIVIPDLFPEKLISLTYAETVELIKDAGLKFTEMELEGAPVILIESISRIISFSKDLKSGAAGLVHAVYLCGLDAQEGALTAMTMPDIIKALGEPEAVSEIIPGAAEILALTVSNGYWERAVSASNARGYLFRLESREITVFFEIIDGTANQALFFKVR